MKTIHGTKKFHHIFDFFQVRDLSVFHEFTQGSFIEPAIINTPHIIEIIGHRCSYPIALHTENFSDADFLAACYISDNDDYKYIHSTSDALCETSKFISKSTYNCITVYS